ncbi:MAG: GNAT family N-acetyltransferase, partial [Verrucomicrobia bacterium]|nr:GNAT family N-acetyltransferase [Verrucomicrobiota bacterium]
LTAQVKPLEPGDAVAFQQFFLAMPPQELLFIKHRVTDLPVIQEWCDEIDYGRNLPLLAWADSNIIGVATLHQQLGGWKRHIGRVSVHVHPKHRGHGLARALVNETVEVARSCGLEKVEAEFIGRQEGAMKMFGLIGFSQLVNLPDYVKDMQAVTHDYVLMGLDLVTDEEYAGMG